MTRIMILFGLICALCAPLTAQVPIPAVDVLIIADESGSMSLGNRVWLAGMVSALEADYKLAGVGTLPAHPNRYALIGYGSLLTFAHVHSNWTNATDMAMNKIGTLVNMGVIEDGYQAIAMALNTLTFRPGAYKTVILITDEDRDTLVPLTRAQILQMLGAKDATLNAIVGGSFAAGSFQNVLGVKWDGTAYIPTGGGNYATVPGGHFVSGDGSTKVDYVELSWMTCGSAWDVWFAWPDSDGRSLAEALADVKVQELVPVVSSIGGKSCADWILAMGCLLYDGGQNCWYWFEYRELGTLTWKQTPKTWCAFVNRIFMDYIRDLKPDTWYQVRACAGNSVMAAAGQVWNIQTFPADTECPTRTGPTQSTCR